MAEQFRAMPGSSSDRIQPGQFEINFVADLWIGSRDLELPVEQCILDMAGRSTKKKKGLTKINEVMVWQENI